MITQPHRSSDNPIMIRFLKTQTAKPQNLSGRQAPSNRKTANPYLGDRHFQTAKPQNLSGRQVSLKRKTANPYPRETGASAPYRITVAAGGILYHRRIHLPRCVYKNRRANISPSHRHHRLPATAHHRLRNIFLMSSQTAPGQ